jgi:hypothetical protein
MGLLLAGCAAIPRDMAGNRRIQKDYYEYYGLDYNAEQASIKAAEPADNSAHINDTLDRLLNEKPKHNSAGWKYQPPR